MHREADCKAVLGVPEALRLQHIISFVYPQPVEQTIPAAPRRRRRPLDELVMPERWRT